MHLFPLEVANYYENEINIGQLKCANWCEKRNPLRATLMQVNFSWLISTNSVDVKVFIIIKSSSFPSQDKWIIHAVQKTWTQGMCGNKLKVCIIIHDMSANDYTIISCSILDSFLCNYVSMDLPHTGKKAWRSGRPAEGWHWDKMIKMPQRVNKSMYSMFMWNLRAKHSWRVVLKSMLWLAGPEKHGLNVI